MRARRFVAALAIFVVFSARATPLRAEPIDNSYFQRTWERTDKPVADGTVSRTWMWGPTANTTVLTESYADAPGGTRQVQYFDKSRMEITHPDGDPNSIWYVTNGLLVVELMTGQLQTGDNQFEPHAPAQVNVAGDADDPNGPTYATFGPLRSAAPLADGASVIQVVQRDGAVTTDNSFAQYGVVAAQHVTAPGLDHQVASPFWTFMNSSGPVYQDGGVTTAALFPNPFYATGLPVTEAYWASAKVAGIYRNVLMQCFERRCLTYTPGNPAGFETEAGNVGQHYHDWRYGSAVTPPATHYAFAGAFGYSADSTLALQSPAGIAIGQHGEITVADAGNYRVAFYTPDGAHEGSVGSKGAGDGQFNSPVDVAYDADGDLFIADRGNHRVVKLTGITFSAFGSTGSGSAALDPACVAVHADLVYVCDLANNRIARFTTAGAYVDSFGNTGSGSSLLVEPFSIAVDAAGTTYVTDMGAPNGEGRVAVFSAGLAYQRDLPIPAGYDYVYCVRVAPDGSIYALDDASRITHYASDGTFIGVWATTEFFASVMSNPGEFMIDGAGNFYVSGVDMARAYGVPGYQYVGMVIRFDASAHPTLILTDDNRYSFDHPVDIAVGTDGNLLISDTTANVSRVDAWAPDGQPAVRDGLRISAGASPSVSTGIAVAPNGTLYVVDAGNNRVLHFDTRWKLLQGFDGTGSSNGPLVAPHGVAVDASGNVYVVDQGNGLIRKFTSDGTDLGSWGSTGDGPGQFAIPMDIAISGQRVYVTDWDLDRVDVFDLNGQYLTSWGSYGAGQGQFDSPRGVAVDAAGYVYVVDSENARVQKFAPDGTWLATFGGGGDKPLHLPQGIAVGPNGEVYVVDSGNQRVVAYAPQ